MDPQFVSFDRVRSFEMAEGVMAKALFGEGAMLNLVELEPGAVVAHHHHPHEQLGLMLRGSMTLNVDGAEHVLREMDGYTLPGDIEHGATAGPEGALVLDVFRPVREDYRDAAGT
ncbi:MAG: cupin domain-containing protein [Solirubrobacterales bacterium]|nr:cupin domain-containing protein [Solirubrobacterales bacterium]MBV9365920.1 cupin domain-containing protein [Solirubrobacterales bacterium]MBV9680331.1 cupin domain-containing protein [Solirubrobacterales bacterium]MBV9807602.1 cupin domain-containing protein [Solirubrobacterales bacterium]